MDKLIASFPEQLREAITIGEKAKLTKSGSAIQNVVASGLGGSGIGGSLVAEMVADEMKLPMLVNKDYSLAAFVNENTLLIISSYSGNTEETVNALEEGLKRKAKITCITSGGKIAEMAKSNGLDLITIPGGMPPRACLGYSLVQQFYVLHFHGLISDHFKKDTEKAIDLITAESEAIKYKSQQLAVDLYNKLPIIYVAANMEAVAVRFRQQLNENSKILCWHHAIPEMNHNELVGWRTKNNRYAVIMLRNSTDFERIKKRMEINKNVLRKYTENIFEIYSKGESMIERALYLVHFTDWASLYLAQNRNVDAVEVNVIDYLKAELGKN